MSPSDARQVEVISRARVAHLATADAGGVPHLIPICFAYDGQRFYSVLDAKPKRGPLTRLKRVRNILSNPSVALLLDHYEEDWDRLWYALVSGEARLLEEGEDHTRAVALLREKYPQYREMDIAGNPVIEITPDRVTWWGKTPGE